MKSTRASTLIGAIAAISLVVAGCGGGTDTAGNQSESEPAPTDAGQTAGGSADHDPSAILRWAVPGPPTSFDLRKSAPLDPVFLDAVYESLIHRAPSGDLEPGLATDWEFTDENKTLVLHLRDGVTFHDGEKFDADAVVASMQAWSESGAQSAALAVVDSVTAPDPKTVRIAFSSPAGYFLTVLSGEAGMVVSPQALDDPDLGTKPVGTGPYRMTSYAQGKYGFRKFDDYWNADEVYNAGIDMTMFTDESTALRAVVSGEADGTPVKPNQVAEAKSAGLSVYQDTTSTFSALHLNTGASEFDDPRVRQALSLAIDRKQIADSLFSGGCLPTVQPFQEGFADNVAALNDTDKFYDVDKAKKLLAEAGLADGFSFELIHGPNTLYQTLAPVLQAQLAKIGITVTIRAVDFSQIIEIPRGGDFESLISVYQPARPDPSQFITDLYTVGGLYNPGDFTLPGLAEKLAESRTSSDDAERSAITQEILAEVVEAGPPLIPICAPLYGVALSPKVTGYEVPRFGDYDFAAVKIAP